MRNLTGIWKWIVVGITACAIGFILFTSLTRPYHPALQGAIILSYGLLVVFLNFPVSRSAIAKQHSHLKRLLFFGTNESPSVIDILFTTFGSIPGIFIVFYWEPIVSNPLTYETYHLVLGALLFFMLMEATRRTLGYIVPIVVTFFIFYTLLGHLLPASIGHAGYGLEELLYIFYLTTEGVWGLLTDLTSRLIAIFILLGPILFACGVGNTFIKWSRFTGGRIRGGGRSDCPFIKCRFGNAFRFLGRECRHNRNIYHSYHEETWLPFGNCGCNRGFSIFWWSDYATHNGCRRLCYGRVAGN